MFYFYLSRVIFSKSNVDMQTNINSRVIHVLFMLIVISLRLIHHTKSRFKSRIWKADLWVSNSISGSSSKIGGLYLNICSGLPDNFTIFSISQIKTVWDIIRLISVWLLDCWVRWGCSIGGSFYLDGSLSFIGPLCIWTLKCVWYA